MKRQVKHRPENDLQECCDKIIKLLCLVICITLLFCVSCTSQTEYGSCIGIADDRKPNLEYKLSIKNAVLGIVFLETIIVPVWVLADETYCPVGVKEQPTK